MSVQVRIFNFLRSLSFHIPVNEKPMKACISCLEGGGGLSEGVHVSEGGITALARPPCLNSVGGGGVV